MYIKDGKEGFHMFQAPNQTPFMQQGPGFNPGFGNHIPNPYQQMPNSFAQPTQSRGLQGLIGRLFSNSRNAGNAMQPMQFPGQAASQFASQAATQSTGGFANTLGNVQQVLKVAQQATPLIREYGPMVKNAPKLMSMLKALSEIQDDEEEENSDEIVDEQGEEDDLDDLLSEDEEDDNLDSLFEMETETGEDVVHSTNHKQNSRPSRSNKTGESTPKLFI